MHSENNRLTTLLNIYSELNNHTVIKCAYIIGFGIDGEIKNKMTHLREQMPEPFILYTHVCCSYLSIPCMQRTSGSSEEQQPVGPDMV